MLTFIVHTTHTQLSLNYHSSHSSHNYLSSMSPSINLTLTSSQTQNIQDHSLTKPNPLPQLSKSEAQKEHSSVISKLKAISSNTESSITPPSSDVLPSRTKIKYPTTSLTSAPSPLIDSFSDKLTRLYGEKLRDQVKTSLKCYKMGRCRRIIE